MQLKSQLQTSSTSAALCQAAEHLRNGVKEEMAHDGTFCPEKWVLYASWELGDIRGTVGKDLSSVPGTEIGSVRTLVRAQCRLGRGSSPGTLG